MVEPQTSYRELGARGEMLHSPRCSPGKGSSGISNASGDGRAGVSFGLGLFPPW